ncbi:MAG TPA: RidA family protein [Dongiaceae bacterium]|jgi:enamine deaminase RidA (YjgF/YER057c/UK114 family)
MRHAVKTHLPVEEAPIEWAVTADGILYTAQIPIHPDGSIETGDIEKQAELTFGNLQKTLQAAGGDLANVTQVLVYLTRKEDFAGMNEVYRRYFSKPYPNRATVIVAGLMVPDAVIEIVAYAHLGKRP